MASIEPRNSRRNRVGPLDILLVEDNPADARLIAEYLDEQAGPNKNASPTIKHVERLAEAVDARHADIDVILLDLGLPDSQKFDSLETMFDASGDEPIVVLTGLDDERVGLEAVERGAQDYLFKDDLTPKLLQQTLWYAMERERQQQEMKQADTLFQNAQDGLFIIDVEGGGETFRVNQVNPAYETFSDASAGELRGKLISEITDKADSDSIREKYRECMNGRTSLKYEEYLSSFDGGSWWETKIAPVLSGGEVTQIVGSTRNITDRKERERRLQIHEIAVQTMTEIAFIINQNRRVQFANDAALDFADMPLEAIKGVPIRAITEEMAAPEEDPQRFFDVVDALLENEHPDVGEWVRDPDGSETLSLEFDLSLESVGDICAEQRFVPVELYDGERGVAVISRDVTKRREKEEEIRTHLDQAQAVGNAGIWNLDIATGNIQLSDECHRILDLDPDTSMTYDRFLQMVRPDDREKVDEALSEVLKEGRSDVKHRIVVDGKTRWVQQRAEVNYRRNGEPENCIGVIRDITEQVQQTREIHAQKERYESLLQSAPDPVFVADANTGKIIETNEAAETLREQDKDEILGLDRSKLYPPDERERARATFGDATVSDGGVWRTYTDGSQIHAVSATGERVPVEITHNTFSMPEGRVSYAIFRDISEQIEREREISEQKRQYESLFNSVSGAVVVTDLDGTITTCNPGFTDLFGYDKDDIEGNHLSTIMHNSADVGRLLESENEDSDSLLVDYRKRSGQVFSGESRSSPLRDYDDSSSGHVVHIVDVSEAEENREQLQVLSRVLRHNVNNDMGVIMGRAKLIEDRGSGELVSHAEKILKTSQKFVEMAGNQRKIAKVLTENPETVVVDLAPTVRHIVADTLSQTRRRNILMRH